MRRLTASGLLLVLATSCDGDDPATGTGTDTDAPQTSGSDEGSTTGTPPETTNPTTSTTTPPPDDDGGTTVPLPECGNATVEPPEECDDGNLEPGDGCEADCTVSVDTRLWQATHGGDAAVQDVGQDVVFDGTGNVYAVGFEVDAVGDANIWVQVYAPDGTPGLEVVLDPSAGADDRGFGIDVDSEGSLYLAGRVGTEKSASDLWFAKLAADGSELWSRTVTGPDEGSDQANAIAVSDDGTVLVGGFIRAGNANNDLWVSAVAGQDGSELWVDTLGGDDGLDDRIGGVGWDPEGNPIVGGYMTNDGFNADIWVRKYAPDGTETWTTQYESIPPSNQLAFDLAIDPDGNVGLAGSTPSTVNDDNVFFIKFDPAGELVQQKTFGSPAIADDAALALAADSEGAFVVVGYKAVSDTDRDIWMRKWDASGNTIWTQNVSGAGMTADQAAGVAIDANDDIAVVGEIRNEPTSDGDIWVAKYAGN